MLKRLALLGAVCTLVLMAVAPATAGPKGTDRPFKADLAGEVTFEFGAERCEGFGPVLTITESWGNASHMGKVWMKWYHCPQDVGFVNGIATIWAANGDKVYLEYDNPTPSLSFLTAIAGGDGRFDDAAGWVDVDAQVTPVLLPGCEFDPSDPLACFDFVTPWPWSATLSGSISY